jgi:hypothetical protein
MIGSSLSLQDFEEIIEQAIGEIEVPPSLRARARSNLKLLAERNGIEAVRQKAISARIRKERAAKWVLARRPAASDVAAVEIAGEEIQQELWSEIESIARDKAFKLEWAQHFLDASSIVERFEGWTNLSDPDSARDVCINLFKATKSFDFGLEPPVIRGSVFAETANLFSACAMLTSNHEVMEESLVFYGNAVQALSEVDDPRANILVAVVQLNRGSALSLFGRMIGEKLHKFREDFNEVSYFLSNESNETSSIFDELAVDVELIRNNLLVLRDFDESFAARHNHSNRRQPPVEVRLNKEVAAMFAEWE